MRILSAILGVCALLIFANPASADAPDSRTTRAAQAWFSSPVPQAESPAAASAAHRRVNVPHFDQSINYYEAAIFWFGRINATDNYADVRLGYTDSALHVRVSVVDRRLWYDPAPIGDALSGGDSVSIYLDRAASAGALPDTDSYRFTGQLTAWETEREPWQAAYRGNGSGWLPAGIPFTTATTWRGDAPNSDADDRGWTIDFAIPFASLDLPTAPAPGTQWRLGVAVHDRDGAAGTPSLGPVWPETMDGNNAATWGELVFGLPAFNPPLSAPAGAVTIRQGLDGVTVTDAAVGGGAICGDGLDFWTEWGEQNYAGQDTVNVQNQADIADWPCFSKYYITFPLDRLPAAGSVLSATLTLYQTGSAGDGAETWPSYLQVFTTDQDWNEQTLTWNNAPAASENFAGTWVDALPAFPGFPGVARRWDVSLAVARAHALSQPLRLILYTAGEAYHGGRYFTASDTGDWNAEGRPALTATWAGPAGSPRAYLPLLR